MFLYMLIPFKNRIFYNLKKCCYRDHFRPKKLSNDSTAKNRVSRAELEPYWKTY